MAAEVSIVPVLEQYPGLGPIRRVHSLANAGGFSGSMLWRIEREVGDICLRRWPKENPSQERLAFIHGVLTELCQNDLSYIPAPLVTRCGHTFSTHAGHFWELTPWMPGKADFRDNPSRTRLANVMKTVARLHNASERIANRNTIPLRDISPTLQSRRDQLHRLQAGEAERIAAAVERLPDLSLQDQGRRLLAHFRRRASGANRTLTETANLKVPLFPVLRDLWHDHVLFTGDEVTGIVDFGAMQVDSVSCDLSRLLGSLVGNDHAAWEFARQAYNSVRSLSTDEWKLVQAFDEANVILAGLNWLDWICVQGRRFENQTAIQGRLDEILSRLEGG